LQIALVKNFKSISVNPNHRIILIRFLVLSILGIWVVGFLLPLITTLYIPFTNFLITKCYSTVCHQESFKCISIENNSMLVCARCGGLYFGAFIASISSLFTLRLNISKRLLLISILPLLIDVFLTSLGVYSYSQTYSFATGIIFGSVIYLFMIADFEKLILKKLFDTGNE
jgi:uncharacterized membrane protein